MIGSILDIWQKRSIAACFVSAQLTISYRTKSLGFVWALLDQPLEAMEAREPVVVVERVGIPERWEAQLLRGRAARGGGDG